MATEILRLFDDFRRILGICPCCGQLFRLSDIRLYYRVQPVRSWLDKLEFRQLNVDRAEERFGDLEKSIRERATERARRKIARLMRHIDPVFSGRGYALEDARALFDPVDFVLFDGMTRHNRVRGVILMDGPALDPGRRKIQRAIAKVVSRRHYEWKTIRLSRDGDIQTG